MEYSSNQIAILSILNLGGVANGFLQICVITSYSIHYTKLYDAKKYAKSFLIKLEETAKESQIPVSIKIQETKSIAKEIIDFAESKKINLIIMGSHGQIV